MIINDEEKMLAFLKANPGNINVIGEELLNKELSKRKNGKTSEILDLLEEQRKCRIYINSPDFLRNNEYIVLQHLQANEGRIGVIGEELLKKELDKRENGETSKILDLLGKQKKCIIFTNSPEILKNDELPDDEERAFYDHVDIIVNHDTAKIIDRYL